eukprot:CAMPEP_0197655946 /NCGR_PEP_ID=MMETSP1338-20131121/39767_1 /TAXON_ID=43686 ORGANISM="Pelagodinium beii, Strain RCC1491" /NCGR_SAMPLE_ID=MMETSP1338 /ASSEMBLY_ACC=CAM_ASM_000754 /LENGTH=325 /DNA_ID=CAMNT_0043231699 /DNA_START=70 /DNA_END=1044 /DNA_ORIENTATION=+
MMLAKLLVLNQLVSHATSVKVASPSGVQQVQASPVKVGEHLPSLPARRGVLAVDTAKRMIKLAKIIPAAQQPPFPTKVPRVIWQSWKSDGFNDSNSLWVPNSRAEMMLTWIEKNPTYEYRLLDDEDVEAYVMKNYGGQHLSALQALNQGASKVDFWRVLALLHDGGVYFDTDAGCVLPLDQWIESQTTYVTGIGAMKDFHQWGLISVSGNCILKQAADLILANIHQLQRRVMTSRPTTIMTSFRGLNILGHDSSRVFAQFDMYPQTSATGVVALAGPPVLMNAANKCLTDPQSQATVLQGFKLCIADFFGNRALFKGPGSLESTW